MNALPSLVPLVPELILVVGAMALLMVGAFGRDTTRFVNVCAILLLLAVAIGFGVGTMLASWLLGKYAKPTKAKAVPGQAQLPLQAFIARLSDLHHTLHPEVVVSDPVRSMAPAGR